MIFDHLTEASHADIVFCGKRCQGDVLHVVIPDIGNNTVYHLVVNGCLYLFIFRLAALFKDRSHYSLQILFLDRLKEIIECMVLNCFLRITEFRKTGDDYNL